MKVNDPNLSSLSSAATAGSAAASRAAQGQREAQAGATQSPAGDDVHLSELVRSLRSLAAESPERQARIEALTRAYASGNYQVDSHATASAIISDATKE
jgi:flagellar biosynthesis anti-sigma factor FlgM